MVKKGLVAEVARRAGDVKRADVALVVDVLFGALAAALARGERIELRGFGTFTVRERPARKARNPKTGGSVQVGERAKIAFTPSKEMRSRVDY